MEYNFINKRKKEMRVLLTLTSEVSEKIRTDPEVIRWLKECEKILNEELNREEEKNGTQE